MELTDPWLGTAQALIQLLLCFVVLTYFVPSGDCRVIYYAILQDRPEGQINVDDPPAVRTLDRDASGCGGNLIKDPPVADRAFDHYFDTIFQLRHPPYPLRPLT